MIPKPFPEVHSRVLLATDPSSREMYGAEYQSLVWAVLTGDENLVKSSMSG
jgi:hypothetical protein